MGPLIDPAETDTDTAHPGGCGRDRRRHHRRQRGAASGAARHLRPALRKREACRRAVEPQLGMGAQDRSRSSGSAADHRGAAHVGRARRARACQPASPNAACSMLLRRTATVSATSAGSTGCRPYQMGSRIIEGDELAGLLPGATKRFTAALYTKTDGRAEPQKAVPALAAAARAAGAVIVENCAVRGLDLQRRARRGGGDGTRPGRLRKRDPGQRGVVPAVLRQPRPAPAAAQDAVLRAAHGRRSASGPETSAWLGSFAYRKRLDGGYTIANGNANIVPITPDTFDFFAISFRPREPSGAACGCVSTTASCRRRARRSAGSSTSRARSRLLACSTPIRCSSINAAGGEIDCRGLPRVPRHEVAQQWAGMIDVTPDVGAGDLGDRWDARPCRRHRVSRAMVSASARPRDALPRKSPRRRRTIVDPTPFRYSRFHRRLADLRIESAL